MDNKLRFTYNDIHLTIQAKVSVINKFKPDVIIAIGTGGFIPARMLKKHLNIPMFAVIIKLYDDITDQIAKEPEKVQWINHEQINWMKGKRVLIVDEIDDTRKTLAYCAKEFSKYGCEKVGIFVVHNKDKAKEDNITDDIEYLVGDVIPDKWAVYPWETDDIVEHDKLSLLSKIISN